MMESITEKINRFYRTIDDTHTRYKSWEWCHKEFKIGRDKYWQANKAKDIIEEEHIVDYLALHLAFYLASWGMYRGSSFLLQHDYKAHKAAVECILNERYQLLWDYQPQEENIQDAAHLLFSEDEAELGVYNEIKEAYNTIGTPTDTLITKILMGTYGCVPAFDRFLKSGIAKYIEYIPDNCINGFKLTQSLNETAFQALAHLAINQHDSVYDIELGGFEYPPMKCLDMFFWEIGYEIDIAEGLISANNKDAKKNSLLQQAVRLEMCRPGLGYNDASSEIRAKNEREEA